MASPSSSSSSATTTTRQQVSTKDRPNFDQDGLVVPRKLSNPLLESRDRKEMHREMLWKMKHGPGEPRESEYRKTFNHFRDRQREKELASSQVTFEKVLEQRKQRLNAIGQHSTASVAAAAAAAESTTATATASSNSHQSESSKVGSDTVLRAKNEEFFRVFSKVCARQPSSHVAQTSPTTTTTSTASTTSN